ncbi:Chromodomain-helicase-DNA-binding protein 1-like [Cichlidogyrus casuarinus]|uniref:Chromodomain-helicase-DNA-binding protein 1-like n=1 Tax=Cichlidogyrus casuarinus TaxID=1844966 RepID=A0ABD2QD88_9PLAT
MIKLLSKLQNTAKEIIKKCPIKSNADLSLEGITLKDYQLEGVNFFVNCTINDHGGILADEMGLGKTCQSIAFVSHALEQLGFKHILICAPLSVLPNWQSEFTRFAPLIKIQVYYGSKEERSEMRLKHDFSKTQVILTTYEVVLKDELFFANFDWNCIIIDEGHRLKNDQSLFFDVISRLKKKYCFLLTGTPIQNDLAELFSMLQIISPETFKAKLKEDFISFMSASDRSLEDISTILDPYLIRRTKELVLGDLPVRLDVVFFHSLTSLQKNLYKTLLTKSPELFDLIDKKFTENMALSKVNRLQNLIMQLRKCVNHPYIFTGIEPQPFTLGEHLVTSSGKLMLLDRLLSFLHSKNHRVLIFSQMTHMLDIVQDYLTLRDWQYERLDGSIRGQDRAEAVDRFITAESKAFVFLLTTKSGGVGLNLVAADTIIFLDFDFNPQNDIQAAARVHRIGQLKPVRIIRLVCRDSIDEVILRRAQAKMKLTDKILGSLQHSSNDTRDTMQELLKFGLKSILEEPNQTELESNFEEILGETVDGQWTLPKSLHGSKDNWIDLTSQTFAANYAPQDLEKAAQLLKEQYELHEKENVATQLPTRRAHKPELSLEEHQELHLKARETANQKAEQRLLKLKQKWEEVGYTSCKIDVPKDEEEGEESNTLTEEEESASIEFRVGDASKPLKEDGEKCVVCISVDVSGSWSRRGFFRCLDQVDTGIGEYYELSAQMKNLHLGDCHLLPLEGRSSFVALLVCLKRSRRQEFFHDLDYSSLDSSVNSLAVAASERGIKCVHMPKVGYGSSSFTWYSVERILSSRLIPRSISVCVYYFKQTAATQKPCRKRRLFTGMCVYLKDNNAKKLKRLIMLPSYFSFSLILSYTHDGDVLDSWNDSATHVIVNPEEESGKDFGNARKVTENWIMGSTMAGKLLPID